MSHRNAPLTPEGRRRLCQRVDGGRPICHVAAEAGIARQTLAKWYSRWEADGEDGLQDRSSRPVSCPNQVDAQVEDVVCYLRRNRKLGPVMLHVDGWAVQTLSHQCHRRVRDRLGLTARPLRLLAPTTAVPG